MKNVDWVESTAVEGGCRPLLFRETCSGKFCFHCGMKLCRNLKNYFCCNCDGLFMCCSATGNIKCSEDVTSLKYSFRVSSCTCIQI